MSRVGIWSCYFRFSSGAPNSTARRNDRGRIKPLDRLAIDLYHCRASSLRPFPPQPTCTQCVSLRRHRTMILVTGASGNLGKAVLDEVALQALETGEAYRAMYRSPIEAAKAPAGTSTVIADFAKKETLPPALDGVHSVFLVCSPIPQLIEFEWNMIDACVAANVGHIVLT